MFSWYFYFLPLVRYIIWTEILLRDQLQIALHHRQTSIIERFALSHREEIERYEDSLARQLRTGLSALRGVRVLGHPAAPKVGVVSFVPTAMDPGQLCDALSQEGFALRAGLHCAPSVHQWLGTLHTGACRASVGIYNTETDVEALCKAIERLADPVRA